MLYETSEYNILNYHKKEDFKTGNNWEDLLSD